MYFIFRAGTAVTTLDNNGRTPLQLAKSKLKLLQRNSPQSDGMSRVSKEAEKIHSMYYDLKMQIIWVIS